MAYGKNGYQYIIENNISLAKQLGQWLEDSDNFKLLAPVRLNTVCFTLQDDEMQDEVGRFLENLNNTGKVFMTQLRITAARESGLHLSIG